MNQLLVDPMKPNLATITGIRNLATGIKLLQFTLDDADVSQAFDYQPGQFVELSAFGVGESPFGITSTRGRGEQVEVAVNRIGTVTDAIHRLDLGDKVGIRGPLGNGFPMEQFKGKDVVVLGGGIGGAPLRPVIQTILDHRSDYGQLSIFWAARTPDLLVFTDEYDDWRAQPNAELHLTVDVRTPEWPHKEGLITTLVEGVGPSADNAITITCGPPIMIRFVLQSLQKLQFSDEQIYTTLEKRMKCGIGICGRCNVGPKYVCVDGPVFSLAELNELPDEL